MTPRPDRYELLRQFHFDQPQERPPVTTNANASDENRVTLTGVVAAEPEIKSTSRGKPFAVVLIESRTSWTGRQGNGGERASVIEVTSWGTRLLPNAGERVRVEGRLGGRAYVDRAGVERHATSVVAETIEPLGANQESNPPGVASGDEGRFGSRNEPKANPPGAPLDDGGIPF